MKFPVDRVAAWAPALVFLFTIAFACYSFVSDNPSVGALAVDVQVLGDSAEPVVVAGTTVSGGVDSATVDDAGFSFNGWADFPRGASLILATRGVVPPPGSRIRLRSLARPDVSTTLHDPALLYSGFSFSATTTQWGVPRCLYLRSGNATRLLWGAPADHDC